MDKELQDIKNALDSITNNMYGLTQLANAAEGIKEGLEKIGQIGIPHAEWTGTPHATLGDIKQAIESIGNAGTGTGTGTDNSWKLDNIVGAIDRNTTATEKLVEAVQTMAEIQLQQLSLQEKTAAEFGVLPWSKNQEEPNLQYGWVEDLEQAEGDLEDATI